MSDKYPEITTAINILQDWVTLAEAQQNGLPADPDAVEALIARSKDYIENV